MPIFPWLVWCCDCGQTARRAGLPLNPKGSERTAKAALKHHEANHSALGTCLAFGGSGCPAVAAYAAQRLRQIVPWAYAHG